MSKFPLGRIEAIIAQLQSADDAAREHYLEHLGSEEPELLAEVLRFMRDSGTFLEGMGEEIWEALTPGTMLIGRTIKQYTIEEVIGVGGMGVVYKAWDSRLKVHVALKFLPERLRGDEHARERFMAEAHTVAQLDHPNVCAIYAVDETENGVPFLSMRLYEGETLRERLAHGPLPAKDAKSILRQTTLGLAAAHAKGLIHRDIKPENLFITNSGSVKILDFGIAAATDGSRIADDDEMAGTFVYMSPEQTRGDPATVQSDLWALGVVGYEMLTNQSPFEAADRQTTIHRILNEKPDALPSSTPKPLARVITTCLHKNPSKRYSRARDVRKVLDVGGKDERWPLIAAVLVLAALGTGLWLGSLLGLIDLRGNPDNPGTASDQPVLDVVPFVSLTGDSLDTVDALGYSEMLREALRETPEYDEYVVREGYGGYENLSTYIADVADNQNEDVDFVLGARMSRTSSGIKLHVELHSASNDRLWQDDYNFPQQSFPSVLDDVLRVVSDRLLIELDVVSKQSERKYSDDPVANRHYVRGRGLLNLRTGSELSDAIKEFNEANSRDPEFADSYAARGLAVALTQSMAYVVEPDSAKYEEARKLALRALELDSTNYLAHLALGFVRHNFDWDWEGAEKHYEYAFERNPQNPDVLHFYSTHLAELANTDDEKRIAKSMQLDATIRSPDAPHYHAGYAMHLYLEGTPQKLLDEMATWAKRMSEFHVSRLWKALALMDVRRFDQAEAAITAFEEATLSDHPMALHLRGRWHAMQGHEEDAIRYADLLSEKFPTLVASIYHALGDREKALEQLEISLAQRGTYMTIIGVWPSLGGLRGDPRFDEILKKMGLDKGEDKRGVLTGSGLSARVIR